MNPALDSGAEGWLLLCLMVPALLAVGLLVYSVRWLMSRRKN